MDGIGKVTVEEKWTYIEKGTHKDKDGNIGETHHIVDDTFKKVIIKMKLQIKISTIMVCKIWNQISTK